MRRRRKTKTSYLQVKEVGKTFKFPFLSCPLGTCFPPQKNSPLPALVALSSFHLRFVVYGVSAKEGGVGLDWIGRKKDVASSNDVFSSSSPCMSMRRRRFIIDGTKYLGEENLKKRVKSFFLLA